MSFVSFSFLVLFTLTWMGRLFLGRYKGGRAYLFLLLAASLLFYASFVPAYLLLLFFTTLVDYYVGWKIHESPRPSGKRVWLLFSLAANLGLLAYFKYADFFLDGLRDAGTFLGLGVSWIPRPEILLPIGISFFTFQSMSYTIDIYRGQIKPTSSYWRFLLFVSFFTHLISGPIVRAKELLYQFDRKRRMRWRVSLHGLYLMILGFFLKMVVADNLAEYVNRYWPRGAAAGMPSSVPLALAFLFACQIFADFFGYTNIAMGSAYLLGFKLPTNFNNPYLAGSFREFWTRWHITLSRWIRDYLYISLGGNKGPWPRAALTLLVTMLLAGLWHGAALTFVVFGGIHGMALALERVVGMNRSEGKPWVLRLFWFVLVQASILTSWVFFRSQNLSQAGSFLANLASPAFAAGDLTRIWPSFLFASPVLLMHGRAFFVERGWLAAPGAVEKSILAAFMLYGVFTLYGKNNAFIYFQF